MQNQNLGLLRQYIAKAEREMMFHKDVGNEADDLAVLFTGNWHDSIPRNIILSQTLLPVEKITWQSIRLTVHQPQQPGSTPKRDDLAMMVNCSPPTITKARQMLRLCRYTTLCSVVRKKGRFIGEIHLLHDEPLDLGTTIELDPTYIEFVQTLAKAGNKSSRVRKEAAAVLMELNKLGAVPPPQSTSERLGERIDAAARSWASEDKPANKLRATDTLHQRKNLSLDQNLNNSAISDEFSAVPVDNHQRKNLSPDHFLNDFDQRKNLSLAVCSSYCGSSKYINILNTCARDNETSETDPAERFTPSFGDWQASGNAEHFESDHLTAHDEQGQPTQQATPQPPAAPVFLEIPASQLTDSYLELNPELDFNGMPEFRALIARFLPEINHRALDRYLDPALFAIQPQIPFIAKVVNSLSPNKRRDVLFQFLARKAGFIHGWCGDDIANPVGFIKHLVNQIYKGHFVLDNFAAELMRAVRENDRPYIHDSADLIAKKKQFETGVDIGQEAAGGYTDA